MISLHIGTLEWPCRQLPVPTARRSARQYAYAVMPESLGVVRQRGLPRPRLTQRARPVAHRATSLDVLASAEDHRHHETLERRSLPRLPGSRRDSPSADSKTYACPTALNCANVRNSSSARSPPRKHHHWQTSNDPRPVPATQTDARLTPLLANACTPPPSHEAADRVRPSKWS